MLKINNLELRFGTRTLFKDVNLELKDNNCYGIIGANGAGKSTFLKIISGEIDSTKGEVVIGKGERISILRQNHNEFDEYNVLETVLMGDDTYVTEDMVGHKLGEFVATRTYRGHGKDEKKSR